VVAAALSWDRGRPARSSSKGGRDARCPRERLAAAQCSGNEVIGENESRVRHVVEQQLHVGGAIGTVFDPDARSNVIDPDKIAAVSAPSLQRDPKFDLYDLANVAFKIRATHQRPVEAG